MAKSAPQRTSALAESIRGRPPKREARPHTRALESRYQAEIKALLSEYRELVGEELFAILPYIGAPAAPKFDDPSDVIERSFSGLRVRISTMFDRRRLEQVSSGAAMQIDRTNREQFRRFMRTVLKVDPLMSEPWLLDSVAQFVRENVSLIRSIPEENLTDIEQMLFRDAARRLSPREMRKKIVELFDVTESRAELIATDQVLKFNGALTEQRQKSIGVTRYIWRTAGDQRVRGNPGGLYPNARPSHYALEGKVCKWSDPPVAGTKGEKLHPGMAIRCRCWAEPVLDDL